MNYVFIGGTLSRGGNYCQYGGGSVGGFYGGGGSANENWLGAGGGKFSSL
jgi:hypothetical protein